MEICSEILSSAFFAVCPYSCSRILAQSMVQIIKNNFFSYLLVLQTSFFGILGWCIMGPITCINSRNGSLTCNRMAVQELVATKLLIVILQWRNKENQTKRFQQFQVCVVFDCSAEYRSTSDIRTRLEQ